MLIPPTSTSTFTVLVKGAGPTGLASAAVLSQLGVNVTVVEKRGRRTLGNGRQNVVAIRPEALRNLDSLGALEFLVARGALTDMTSGATANQWNDSVFDWNPLFRRYPAARSREFNEEEGEYVIPSKITDQIPSSFVHLGDLEDALLHVCESSGVRVLYGTTARLEPTPNGSQAAGNPAAKYVARMIMVDQDSRQNENGNLDGEILTPDLIVCASGKNDIDLTSDLGFRRHVGVQLDEQCLPQPDPQTDSDHSDDASNSSSSSVILDSWKLKLGTEGEIESQNYAVFALRHPHSQNGNQSQPRAESTNGVITHIVRKDGTGTPPQPLTEITMSHKDVSHFIVQLPRDLDVSCINQSDLESYVVSRVNAKLDTDFTSVQSMQDNNSIVVGDPRVPVLVETATAPTFVYGSNVVLVGDAAMSCSPACVVGADIGMTVDSRNVQRLGVDLLQSLQNEGKERDKKWDDALLNFNRRKAEAAVIWSQASRMFYITSKEADTILQGIKSHRDDAMAKA